MGAADERRADEKRDEIFEQTKGAVGRAIGSGDGVARSIVGGEGASLDWGRGWLDEQRAHCHQHERVHRPGQDRDGLGRRDVAGAGGIHRRDHRGRRLSLCVRHRRALGVAAVDVQIAVTE